jgi:hypothetical protein
MFSVLFLLTAISTPSACFSPSFFSGFSFFLSSLFSSFVRAATWVTVPSGYMGDLPNPLGTDFVVRLVQDRPITTWLKTTRTAPMWRRARLKVATPRRRE